jgi:4-amino-4-deoxy-L-arabinose transferase-like glycosyltransferase
VLSYVAIARTPIQRVPAGVAEALRGFDVLSVVCAAALTLVSVAFLVRLLGSATPKALRWCADRTEAIPLWTLALGVALPASYLAARISLCAVPKVAGRLAFGLWFGALILAAGSCLPAHLWRRLRLFFGEFSMVGFVRSEAAALVLLAVLALTLRVFDLGGIPPFVCADEEEMGTEVLRVVRGQRTNMFEAGFEGVPTMVFFSQAAAVHALGVGVAALRLVPAVVGTLAVLATYLALREMFGWGPGLIGAVFMAGYHFHLHFSRTGVANVGDSLLTAVALYLAYRASRGRERSDFAALGLVCGLSLYVYSSTRIIPLVVVAYGICVSLFDSRFLRRSLQNAPLAVWTFLVAALPIGAYFAVRPDVFAGRLTRVGLFQSEWFAHQIQLGRTPVQILLDQALHAFGGYVYYPIFSNLTIYNSPPPLVPGLSAIPFLLGFAYAIFHIREKQYLLLLLCLGIPTLFGGVLTVPATSWQRYLATIPAISGCVGIGLWQLSRRIFPHRPSAATLAALVAVGVLAVQNVRLYFRAAANDVVFGRPLPAATVSYVRQLPADTRIYWFGAPDVYANFLPFSLYDRDLVEVAGSTAQLLRPVQHPSPSVYLFMAHREEELPRLMAKCPGGVTKTISFRGRKELEAYELLSDNTCIPSLDPAPDNDEFSKAVAIVALPFNHTVNTTAAHLEPGEPQPGPAKRGDPRPCGSVQQTVWYSYVPPQGVSRVVARTIGTASDTLIAVYEGNVLGKLTAVACSTGQPDHGGRIEFSVRPGVMYYFQVASLGSVSFTLEPAISTSGT